MSICQRPDRVVTGSQVLEEELVALRGRLDRQYIDRCQQIGKDGALDAQTAEAQRLREICRLIHRQEKPRVALCLSGGGIRSAAYALGVVQALSFRGVMHSVDFLSTVSGGGMLGGWLSAWIHRDQHGAAGVFDALGNSARTNPAVPQDTLKPLKAVRYFAAWDRELAARGAAPRDEGEGAAVTAATPDFVSPEAVQIRHLREYNNYLTPRLGIASLDTWAVIATYLRNLLVNWLVLIPLLMAGMMVPWLIATMIQVDVDFASWMNAGRWLLVAGTVLGLVAMVIAIAAVPSMDQPDGAGAERSSTSGAASQCTDEPHQGLTGTMVTWAIVIPILVSCITTAWAWMAFTEVEEAKYEKLPSVPFLPQSQWLLVPGNVAFYLVAGCLAQLVVRRLRKPNIPSIAATLSTMAALGLVGGLGVAGLAAAYDAAVPLFRQIEDSRRFGALAIVPALLLVYLLSLCVYVGVSSKAHRGPFADEDREWWGRLMGALLSVVLCWLVVCGIAFYSPYSIGFRGLEVSASGNAIGLAGVVAAAIALAGGVSAASMKVRSMVPLRWYDKLLKRLPALAAPIAIFALGFFVAILVDWLLWNNRQPFQTNSPADLRRVLLWFGGLALWIGVAGRVINFNQFSLHSMYRSRLIRAFLAASRTPGMRQANAYTGFDPLDNLPMHYLRCTQAFTKDDVPLSTVYDVAARLTAGKDNLDRHVGSAYATTVKQMEATLRTPPVDSIALRRQVLELLNSMLGDEALPGIVAATERVKGCPELAALARKVHLPSDLHFYNRFALSSAYLTASSDTPARPPAPDHNAAAPRCLHGSVQVTRPFHVVNLALNLVAGRNLAWQQRKAASFTISPLHAGYYRGYRSTTLYGDGISLGTAVTVSGAAASSNMGYHSSGAVTFLMTLFNLRLGWWLGNPAPYGQGDWVARLRRWAARTRLVTLANFSPDHTYRLPAPRLSVQPLLHEALGLTDDRNEYVYLSDGGHFENLGLYEMVRRRCRYIIVSDASCDPHCTLQDLANAIRKVRIDLGIPIQMNKGNFAGSEQAGKNGVRYCAVGTIDYSAVDGEINGRKPLGLLIYIKPAISEHEPVDVYNYARTSREFPHETTADQWFDEAQFESYRRLGQYAVEDIASRGTAGINTDAAITADPVLQFAHAAIQYSTRGARSGGRGAAANEDLNEDRLEVSREFAAARMPTDPGGKGGKEGPAASAEEPVSAVDRARSRKGAKSSAPPSDNGNGPSHG